MKPSDIKTRIAELEAEVKPVQERIAALAEQIKPHVERIEELRQEKSAIIDEYGG